MRCCSTMQAAAAAEHLAARSWRCARGTLARRSLLWFACCVHWLWGCASILLQVGRKSHMYLVCTLRWAEQGVAGCGDQVPKGNREDARMRHVQAAGSKR